VNTAFQLDMMNKTRLRDYVHARMFFSKILKEEGVGSTEIANLLLVTHATVHNYWEKIDTYLFADKKLKDLYFQIREKYFSENDPMYEANNLELKQQIIILREQNKKLTLFNEKIMSENQEIEDRRTKMSDIISMIKQRIRPNTEREVEKKLRRFFNGIYD